MHIDGVSDQIDGISFFILIAPSNLPMVSLLYPIEPVKMSPV